MLIPYFMQGNLHPDFFQRNTENPLCYSGKTWNIAVHIWRFSSDINFWFIENSLFHVYSSVQFSSFTQSCLILCNPMNCSMPGLPVHHHLPEFILTHVHRVSDAIQQSHPLSSPFLSVPNLSHHQSLFQWVNSSPEVAKVLEFQL